MKTFVSVSISNNMLLIKEVIWNNGQSVAVRGRETIKKSRRGDKEAAGPECEMESEKFEDKNGLHTHTSTLSKCLMISRYFIGNLFVSDHKST